MQKILVILLHLQEVHLQQVSDGTRGLFFGAYQGGGIANANIIEYITIATLGNGKILVT